MNGEPRVSRHVVVRGQVQGVSFRAFVEHHATQRNLEGWVRNRRDGAVVAVFSGPLKSVDGMIVACGVGPLGARVDALDQREPTAEEAALGRPGVAFSVLPTV
jgi:acylphosphatase